MGCCCCGCVWLVARELQSWKWVSNNRNKGKCCKMLNCGRAVPPACHKQVLLSVYTSCHTKSSFTTALSVNGKRCQTVCLFHADCLSSQLFISCFNLQCSHYSLWTGADELGFLIHVIVIPTGIKCFCKESLVLVD